LATIDKYISQVIVLDKPSGVKQLVSASEFLVKDTKAKFVCCWIESTCTKNVAGYCTHEKYCNQKGKVTSSSFDYKTKMMIEAGGA
jgi:hypothetical protein